MYSLYNHYLMNLNIDQIKNIAALDPSIAIFALSAIAVSAPMSLLYVWFAQRAGAPLWQVMDLFGWLGGRMNRTHRPFADRVFRGFCLCALALLLIVTPYLWVQTFIPPDGGTYIKFILFASMLSSLAPIVIMWRLQNALREDEAPKGLYLTLSRTTRLDLSSADSHTLARAALEYSAIALNYGFILPLLVVMTLGVEVALIVSLLTAFILRFGRVSAFTLAPRAILWLPAQISGFVTAFLMRIASIFAPGGKIWPKGVRGDSAIATLASALNITLGGPYTDLSGSAVKQDWIGPEGASARVEPTAIRRAMILLFIVKTIVVLGLLITLTVIPLAPSL